MNQISLEQVEQLKEIGAHLRQLRQDQSIPIEEVADKTLIRSSLLRALEEGQSDQLPEPVYVQGFIRRYGDVLGLDGSALAKTFPTTEILYGPTAPVEPEVPELTEPVSLQPYVPLVTLVVLLASATGGLFYLLTKPQTVESTVRQHSPVTNPEKAVATPSPDLVAVPLQVSVSINDESWLRVKADGKTVFEGLLNKGTRQTWTAKKQLTIRTGNAGAVLTEFNQEKPKTLGSPGEVKEVTFTLIGGRE